MVIDYSDFLESIVAMYTNVIKYDWFCSMRKIKKDLVSEKRSK